MEEIGRMLVEHILRRKGRRIAIVDPEATISRALEILAQDNIGALPVVRDGRIVGMLSERDVARVLSKVVRCPKDMWQDVLYAKCAELMLDGEAATASRMADGRMAVLSAAEQDLRE